MATVSVSLVLVWLNGVCLLAVVEQIGNTASLYSRSIQSHHLCLLVKLQVSCFIPSISLRSIALVTQYQCLCCICSQLYVKLSLVVVIWNKRKMLLLTSI